MMHNCKLQSVPLSCTGVNFNRLNKVNRSFQKLPILLYNSQLSQRDSHDLAQTDHFPNYSVAAVSHAE